MEGGYQIMSKQVDERVVEMRFDNAQFERNVSTSMSTLDKLKKSLNLDGAAKGLENVNVAAKSCDFSVMGNSIDTIKAKFSALQVMAVTALANITNSAVNAGKRMVSAITIEPIKAGFQEYETQMNAVQTILANTQKEGTNIKIVNKALDELNTYADKTIYNFTEMTRNIGTFTAAGVKLDTSVSSIKGIANLAAVSGSTSQQASTAMYQLSQAIASGTVKLMDWNSVVNAGMGGQVFQDALIRTSEHLKTGAKAAIKAQGSFRESLKSEWLTTEVLTQTLDQFATAADTQEEYEAAVKKFIDQGYSQEEAKQMADMAKTAGEAATKVKTFTQLIDTLKEALGSGWTTTWRLIIGDFEEAKTLWTEVSDYFSEAINKSSEARNSMLEEWADGGGRTMLIDSFKSAFEGLINVITPIKEAFKEIFLPITSEQILKITERIHDLSAKFRELTEKNAPKLKSTFKGIFSVFKIGVTIIKAVVGGIARLIGKFSGLGGGILSITSSLGDWISGVSKSITETNLFGKAVDKVVGFLEKAIDKLKEFGSYLKGKFEAPGFKTFAKILDTIWTGIKKVGLAVVKVASSIGKALGTAFQNGNLKSLLDLVNGGIITSILLKLKNWVGGFKDLAGEGKGFVQSIKDVLGTVGESLEEWQKNIKAETLKKIAISIGILAASLLVLSYIDPEKLGSALGAITSLFIELIGAMKVFDKLKIASNNAGKSVLLMIGMSVAVLILASSLKKLSSLDLKDIVKGVGGVISLLGALTGAMVALSKFTANSNKLLNINNKDSLFSSKSQKQLISIGLAMIAMAAAIKILASACKDLGSINTKELFSGIAGLVILMASLTGAMVALSKVSDMSEKTLNITKDGLFSSKSKNQLISIGLAMIAMASAMKILASAAKDFADINDEGLFQAEVAITTILGLVVGFNRLCDFIKSDMTENAKSLVVLGVAMELFAHICQKFGGMSWPDMGKAGAAIAGILLIASGFAKLSDFSKYMNESMESLIVMGLAMEIFAHVCKKFGSMDWESLGKAGAAIGGILVLAEGFILLSNLAKNNMLETSGSLLMMAAALLILIPVLTTLGSMSGESIAQSLTAIATAFTIIGVAGLLLEPVVPAIKALSGAVVLFGLGCLAAGIGIAAFAAGLMMLATLTAAGATAIVAALHIIIVGILELIPAMVDALTDAIIALCQVFIQSVPAICDAVKVLIIEMVNTLVECVPAIIEGIIKVINMLVEYTPQLINGLINLIIALLNALSTRISDLIGSLVNFLVSLFNGISANIAPLIEAWLGIFAAIFQGVANAIGPIIQNIIAPMLQVLVNLIVGVVKALAPYIPIICAAITQVTSIISAAIVRIIEAIAPYIPAITNMIQTIINAIVSIVQQITPIINSITGLIQQLGNSITQILIGISIVIKSIGLVIAQVFQGIANTITSVGDAIRNSLDGLAGVFDSVFGGISDVITSVGDSIRNVLDGISGIIDSVGNAALNAGTGFEKLANGIETITKLNLIDMAASMGAVATAIGSITSHSEDLSESGKGMQQIADGTKLSAQAFTMMVTGITLVTTALSSIGSIATDAMSILKSAVSDTASCFTSMSATASSASTSVTASIASMSEVCYSAARAMTISFSAVGSTLISNMASGMQSDASRIHAIMTSLLTSLVSLAKGSVDQFTYIGRMISIGLANGIENATSMTIFAFSSALLEAVSNARSYYSSFYRAGSYVAQGFADGIKDNRYKAETQARIMAQNAATAAAKELKINSPSKVFRAIAYSIPEGFAQGIDRRSGMVEESAISMADLALNSTKNAISRVAEFINSDIDAQPTIRPVVDMSDVESSVDSINGIFSMNPSISVLSKARSISTMMNENQNGNNSDVISAIKDLGRKLDDKSGDIYNFGDFTYDDSSNVSDAVRTLVRAVKIEGRR